MTLNLVAGQRRFSLRKTSLKRTHTYSKMPSILLRFPTPKEASPHFEGAVPTTEPQLSSTPPEYTLPPTQTYSVLRIYTPAVSDIRIQGE